MYGSAPTISVDTAIKSNENNEKFLARVRLCVSEPASLRMLAPVISNALKIMNAHEKLRLNKRIQASVVPCEPVFDVSSVSMNPSDESKHKVTLPTTPSTMKVQA